MERTFGRVVRDGGQWAITCEPHVRARLKRVFPRAPQQAADVLFLSDTPEHCRELEWFLQRYPMEVMPAELLAARAALHRQQEDQIRLVLAAQVQAGEYAMARPPREYQVQAADLLEVVGGLLLADDVGSGKTVTAIAPMARAANRPVLCVVPTHMPGHWLEKIGEFMPDLAVHVVKKGQPYPITRAVRRGQEIRLEADQLPDVLVVNYHKLRGWAEQLAGAVQYVVFDECQQLRGHTSDIYRACRHVAEKARRVIGLSATPIYNYGGEFYWVVNALKPSALGERDEFVREWCLVGDRADKARIKDPELFGAYLRREGIMLRRTLRDIGRELQPVQKIPVTVDADVDALERISGNAVRLAQIILAANESHRGAKMQASGEFDKIVRQATGIAKAPAVASFVRLLLDSEERVILFGWHHAVYNIWNAQLHDFRPVFYTGQESPADKARALERFTKGDSRVLVMSLRSGAGVDGLQDFVRVGVFGELDWSPGVHEQCIGRFHRDDQAEPCVAYFLTADSGADPVMMDVLGVKREQAQGVRDPDQPLIARADIDEGGVQRLAREFLERRGELALEPSGAA